MIEDPALAEQIASKVEPRVDDEHGTNGDTAAKFKPGIKFKLVA